jgi:hypothetical protein
MLVVQLYDSLSLAAKQLHGSHGIRTSGNFHGHTTPGVIFVVGLVSLVGAIVSLPRVVYGILVSYHSHGDPFESTQLGDVTT